MFSGTYSVVTPLICHFLHAARKPILRVPRVPARCVDVLVAKNLRESHEVVGVVGKILVRERVAKCVRMQRHAGDGGVLVAEGANATRRQRSSLSKKQVAVSRRRAHIEIRLEGSAGN